MQGFVDKWHRIYESVQRVHYELSSFSAWYRYVSLTLFALFAPLIVAVLWAPPILADFVAELRDFYRYLPAGYAGVTRDQYEMAVDTDHNPWARGL